MTGLLNALISCRKKEITYTRFPIKTFRNDRENLCAPSPLTLSHAGEREVLIGEFEVVPDQYAVQPPSTVMCAPVMYFDSSLAM